MCSDVSTVQRFTGMADARRALVEPKEVSQQTFPFFCGLEPVQRLFCASGWLAEGKRLSLLKSSVCLSAAIRS